MPPVGGSRPQEDPAAAKFRQLDHELPVALLPVRLATRFVRKGRNRPHALRIRIFPDAIIADAHDHRLTRYEAELGLNFWRRCFETKGDAVEIDNARAWLIAQLDEPRALWVARATRPDNVGDVKRGVEPRFPRPEIRDHPARIRSAMLPSQWVVNVRVGNEREERFFSTPVDRSEALTVAPQLAELPEGAGAREFLAHQDLEWRLDFDAAVRAGMGIEIPVTGEARTKGFSSVLVFGILDGDQAPRLERLLEHHRYDQGLTLLPQGTPTNNTDGVRVERPAGATPELDLVRAKERPRKTATKPAELYRLANADAARQALGLGTSTALDHAEIAGRSDGEWTRAMNLALWPGLGRRLFDDILNSTPRLLRPPELGWLRNWFRDYVRGSAVLPTLGVGDVPYGLLPTMVLPDHIQAPEPGNRLSMLTSQVVDWELAWHGSASEVATMSPLTEGVAPGATAADEAVEVAAILGAVPHPTAFRLRRAALERNRIGDDWQDAVDTLDDLMNALPPNHSFGDDYANHLDRMANASSATGQKSSLGTLAFWVDNSASFYQVGRSNPAKDIVDHIEEVMYPLLEDHVSRSRSSTMHDEFSGAELTDDKDPDLWYVNYAPDDQRSPILSIAGEPTRDELVADLDARIDMITAKATGRQKVAVDWTERKTLLFAMIDQSIELVDKGGEAAVRQGLQRLRRMVATAEHGEQPAWRELERLTRETLGLFSHRQDAWRTSLAAERLGRIRAARPTGVRAGCYGWLLDLVPDDGTPDTQGFVHAPSLDHAATAAMLRSAWQGLGQSASDAPFAVDLSSDRVRRGEWLLAGIRNGHELGDLLGQRLERRLHDARLDAYIDDVRRAVLEVDGRADEPASAIVDGLAVGTAYRESHHGEPLHAALEAIRTAAPTKDRGPLTSAFLSTEGDLDAVADLLMAQGVLSLVQGNVDAAGASLATVSSNPGGVPDPTVAEITPTTLPVSHRVAAMFRPEAVPEPDTPMPTWPLELWLHDMLPPFMGMSVGGFRLDQLGITATHLVSWCPAHVPLAESRLAQFLGTFLATDGDPAPVLAELEAVEDAAVVAGALAEAVGTARPLMPADLVDPFAVDASAADAPASWDLDELAERVAGAAGQLRFLADEIQTAIERERDLADQIQTALEDERDLADQIEGEHDHTSLQVLSLAALYDFGATLDLRTRPSEEVAEAATAVADRFRTRADALDEVDTTDIEAMVTALDNGLDSLVPAVPIMTPIGEELGAMVEDGARRLRRPRVDPPGRAHAWLLATGRVHDGVDAIHQAALVSESVAGERRLAPALLQFPFLPDVDDGWAALDRPDGRAARSRLSFISVTDPTDGIKAGELCGLLFDAWTETIPGEEITTGVAVNFDSPTSRAPQSVLLAVAPDSERWDLDLMVQTLMQTLDAAQNRAVGPETLQSHGHLLPAVFLPERVDVLTVKQLERAQREGAS